jgi:hypothetical protein
MGPGSHLKSSNSCHSPRSELLTNTEEPISPSSAVIRHLTRWSPLVLQPISRNWRWLRPKRLSLRRLTGIQTQACESSIFGVLFSAWHPQPLDTMGMFPESPILKGLKTNTWQQNDVEHLSEYHIMARLFRQSHGKQIGFHELCLPNWFFDLIPSCVSCPSTDTYHGIRTNCMIGLILQIGGDVELLLRLVVSS